MLPLLEPFIDETICIGKKAAKKTSKNKKAEMKLLTKRYKRELRGAVRELRRDNEFLKRFFFFVNPNL